MGPNPPVGAQNLPVGTFVIGEGHVGEDQVGYTTVVRSLAPFYVGDGHVGEECVGTPPDPRSFVGPGLVIGSSISFVGEGRIGATDEQWAPLCWRRQVDRQRLSPYVSWIGRVGHALNRWLPLDEGGAVHVARDLSPNRHVVLLSDPAAQWDWRPIARRCAKFTGSSTIDFGSDQFAGSSGEIGCWVRFDSILANDQAVLQYWASKFDYLIVGIDANSKLFIEVADTNTALLNRVTVTSNFVKDKAWHYVTWGSTSLGGNYFITVDGVSQSLTATTGTNTGEWFGSLTIDGGYTGVLGGSDVFASSIAYSLNDFALWEDRVLSDAERKALFVFPDSPFREAPPRLSVMGPRPTPSGGSVGSAAQAGDDGAFLKLAEQGVPTAAQPGSDSTFLKLSPRAVPSAEAEGRDQVFLKLAEQGVPTAEREGTDAALLKLGEAGVPTAAQAGSDQVFLKLVQAGVPTAEREGSDQAFLKLGESGVPTAAQAGSDSTFLKLVQQGVASAAQAGSDQALLKLSPAGVPTAERAGADAVRLFLSQSGVPTGERAGVDAVRLLLQQLGVASSESAGIAVVTFQVPSGNAGPVPTITVILADTNLALAVGPTDLQAILGGSGLEVRLTAADLVAALAQAGISVSVAAKNIDVELP